MQKLQLTYRFSPCWFLEDLSISRKLILHVVRHNYFFQFVICFFPLWYFLILDIKVLCFKWSNVSVFSFQALFFSFASSFFTYIIFKKPSLFWYYKNNLPCHLQLFLLFHFLHWNLWSIWNSLWCTIYCSFTVCARHGVQHFTYVTLIIR